MATLTIEASGTCDPATYAVIRNAISSLVSAAGHTRCDWRDGLTIEKSGPAVARASRLAKRVSAKASPTIGTFGQRGSGSFASAALQSSLENKLHGRLGTDGSTPWPMTWKAKVTPSGRQYCQLARLRHRTNANDCGLWPTPAAQSYGSNQGGAAGRTGKVRYSLESLAKMGRLPSPGANDYKSGADYSDGRRGHSPQLRHLMNGPLNPTFPAWLMGYPLEWLSSAPSETPSSRKSRRNS